MAGLMKLSTILLLVVVIGTVSSAVLARENVENEEYLRRAKRQGLIGSLLFGTPLYGGYGNYGGGWGYPGGYRGGYGAGRGRPYGGGWGGRPYWG